MQRTSLQDFLVWVLDLINSGIIPFLFAIAFLFFIWNAARFFVFKGHTEEGQDSAKRLMFYGIAAMVLMLSLWGLVRLMTGAFGINRSGAPCPDFNPDCFDLKSQNTVRDDRGGLYNSGYGAGDDTFR